MLGLGGIAVWVAVAAKIDYVARLYQFVYLLQSIHTRLPDGETGAFS